MGFVGRFRVPLIVLSALCFFPAILAEVCTEPFMPRFGLTLFYLGFGAILALNLPGIKNSEETVPGTLQKMLARVGGLSYSLYLWHMPACEAVLKMKIPRSSTVGLWTAVVIYLILAGLAGLLAYQWVEKPSLAWRDRVFP